MKATKIIYWITTAIVALMMAFSGFMYLTKPEMADGFHHLGFSDSFRKELAIGKFIGAILLLAPVATRVKEWVYAAFVIVFISAFIAHNSSGDPVQNQIMPLVFLVLLVVSYLTYHKWKSVAQ